MVFKIKLKVKNLFRLNDTWPRETSSSKIEVVMAEEQNLTSIKSNHADNKLMPNGENEKDNLSQEKHIISSYTRYVYVLDKFRKHEDITFMTKDCKSRDGEVLLHCLGHQHVKCEQELWTDLLSNGNFKLKPCNINVLIVDNVPRHPTRMGNIQWSWLVEEIWRIRTFHNYPQNAAKSAILLASDGFAYVGNGRDVDDSVICFFCESVKNKWQPLDDICEVHKQLSPSCSMVTHINCPNIPLKTNHDLSLFDKVFKIQKYQRNLNASENRNNIQDIEHDVEITATNRPNLPVSSQGISAHIHSLAATPNQSDRVDDFLPSLSSASQCVRGSPSNAVSSVRTSFSNDVTTTAGNTVLSTANNLVSDSSNFVTASASANTPSSDAVFALVVTTVPSATTDSHASAVTVNQAVGNSSQNTIIGNAGGPTYSELGIVTERPKRFALLAKRIETFLTWPRDHHLRPEELAEAGFYYAGYGDCARCFSCGGGLRNWDDEDDVWVEHARWFPKCAYIRQQMGQVFVDIVQELNKTNDHIPFNMVAKKTCQAASAFQVYSKDSSLNYDNVIQKLVLKGFPSSEVTAMTKEITVHGLTVLLNQGYNLEYIYLMFVKFKRNEKPSTNQRNQLRHPLHSCNTYVRTRLNTLQKYDDDNPIRNKDIAIAGFFYKCEKKHLICHWCGKKIRTLRREENPFFEHARLNQDCGYINQLMGNFFVYFVQETEINDDSASGIPDSASLYPTNSPGKMCPNYREQKSERKIKARTSPEYEEEELALVLMRIVPCTVLDNPQFSSTRSRRISFHNTEYESLKHLLAKAGFFYDASSGSIKCFCCGGGVKHFPDNVNIFIYHAQTFHECRYIMLAKDVYNSAHTSSNVDTGSTVLDESNKDIEQLPPGMLCKICCLQRRCICYFPCHHLICCIDCGFGVTTCQSCESPVTFIKYVQWSLQAD